ncbi:MFS transporter [Sorangium sp. So ce861]|uniref:MFS transporter n=1 Tax=Sorangium sp. So ce861 TaxID=3133323 RepID=UPI003F5F5FCB
MRPLSARQAERRYLALSGLRWFATGLIFPVMVLLYTDRGLDLPTAGLLVALYSGVVIALELPTGGLADQLGRRRTMLLSGALSVVSLTGLAFARTWWQFAAVALVSATARALGSGPLEAWYVDTARAADPGTALRTGISRGWAVEALGLGLAATLGGWLPGLADGLRSGGVLSPFSVPALAAAAVATASLIAHAALMVEPGDTGLPRVTGAAAVLRDVPAQVASGVRLASSDPVVRLLVLRMAAVGFAIAALELLTPLQLAEMLGGADRAGLAYGALATAAWLGSAAGSAAAPALCRAGTRVGLASPLSTAAAGTALFGLAVALIGLAAAGPGGLALAAAGYVLAYVSAGVPGPLTTEALHERVDAARRATLISVESLAFQLGCLVGSVAVARVAAWAGYPYGWAAAAGALLVAASLTVRAAARARSSQAAPEQTKAEDSPAHQLR